MKQGKSSPSKHTAMKFVSESSVVVLLFCCFWTTTEAFRPALPAFHGISLLASTATPTTNEIFTNANFNDDDISSVSAWERTLVPHYPDASDNQDDDDNDATTIIPPPGKTVAELKQALLELVPRMTGKNEEEVRLLEGYVNALEEMHQPAQTLGFLNLAMAGNWQLLFSTNLVTSGISPNRFRLRELVQRVECNGWNGTITNRALWDLSEEGNEDDEYKGGFSFATTTDSASSFDCTGTFSVLCDYHINQGSRMIMELKDHVLRPAKGSPIPKDVPTLVGRLHRAMPLEMFDPNQHAIDTTYLDADLRIVRMTGPRLEGVRDIFIRSGSLQIDPTQQQQQ